MLDPGPATSEQRARHLGAKQRPIVPEEHGVFQGPGVTAPGGKRKVPGGNVTAEVTQEMGQVWI